MPSVALLPPSPAFAGFGPSNSSEHAPSFTGTLCQQFITAEMQNGYAPRGGETAAEIKAAAKEQAQKVRGASATYLLRTAGDQSQTARAQEGSGELREALGSLTKAASLVNMFMESLEFKQERQGKKGGVLTREFMSFLEVCNPLVSNLSSQLSH